MNEGHDLCIECIQTADRLQDDIDCMNCGCKGCPWIHNCVGQCYNKQPTA